MKKAAACALICVFLGLSPVSLEAHYRRQQYLLAEKGLEPVLLDISTHVSALEGLAAQLESLGAELGEGPQRWICVTVEEIVQHQAMRAWYNRLLFQYLSDEAVSLGQMSTILKLSFKSLSNGVYQLTRVCGHGDPKLGDPCDQAIKTLRSLSEVYERGLGVLKSVIRSEEDSQGPAPQEKK